MQEAPDNLQKLESWLVSVDKMIQDNLKEHKLLQHWRKEVKKSIQSEIRDIRRRELPETRSKKKVVDKKA